MKKSLSDYLKMPEKHIPDGLYCYNNDGLCPFWESKRGEYPTQEDGFCHFLGKSDWDLNEERKDTTIVVHSEDKEIEGKSVSEVYDDEKIDPISGKTIHFGLSLIWDQCKECGVNMEDPEDMEYTVFNVDLPETIKNKLGK